MTTQQRIIAAFAVLITHFLLAQWRWHAFLADVSGAAAVRPPPELWPLLWPIGTIGIAETGGELPAWAVLGQGALWAMAAYWFLRPAVPDEEMGTPAAGAPVPVFESGHSAPMPEPAPRPLTSALDSLDHGGGRGQPPQEVGQAATGANLRADPSRTAGTGGDIAARLRQLEALHEEGLITREEFDRKRRALLDTL